MKRAWMILRVGDVPGSFKWYQALFGQPATSREIAVSTREPEFAFWWVVRLPAQTVQSPPNVVYTYQWFRREPRRNHPS